MQVEERALQGRLRVDMPIGLARQAVVPRLPEFLAAHPRLSVELSSTDRRVDLVREGFDCVVRAGALADSSLVARPLGQYRQINVASPAYLAAHGTRARSTTWRSTGSCTTPPCWARGPAGSSCMTPARPAACAASPWPAR